MELNQNQLFKAQETFEDFKVLLIRYKQVKDDEHKLKSFFIRNRNPLWDLTNAKFYKTGLLSEGAKKVEKKDLKLNDGGLMETLISTDFKSKLFQLWFYKFLFASEMSQPSENNKDFFATISKDNLEILPGIISFRNLDARVLHEDQGLWFTEGQSLAAFTSDSISLIRTWVHRILDDAIPFEKTKDIASCQFCDFKVICHREI
jgi:hypothetical protein